MRSAQRGENARVGGGPEAGEEVERRRLRARRMSARAEETAEELSPPVARPRHVYRSLNREV